MNELSILLISLLPAAAADDGVQVIEFTGPGCPACVQMAPVVNRLKRDGFPIVEVNPRVRTDLSQRYGITAMPTFVVLVDGKVFDQQVGITSEARLRNMILAGKRASEKRSQPAARSGSARAQNSRRPEIELLDFTADYCQSCVSMEGIIAGMKKDGYPIRQVSVSDDWSTTRRNNIRVLPTYLVMVDGKEVDRHEGTATSAELRKVMKDAKRKYSSPGNGSEEPVVRAKLDQRDADGKLIKRSGPLAASVRLRVRVTGGKQINLGSGVVVESRPGRSLVLTCAHIIDQIGKNPDIDVHVFTDNNPNPKSWKGEVVAHDIKSDIGLIAVHCPGPLPVADIAAESASPKVGNQVFSIGCGRGSIPTRMDMRVVEINRYDGAANIECSRTPEGGRSGGALFNEKEQIIGICSAADKDLDEGIYAGPGAIYAMLEKQELSYLFESNGERVAGENVATNDLQNPTNNSQPEAVVEDLEPPNINHAPVDIRELMAGVGDAEVTCIINPKSGGDSRVVIIHKASEQFVDWLEGELGKEPQPAMHSVKPIAKTSQPVAARKQRRQVSKPTRTLERPLITSDASHSRTWPYVVRRPESYSNGMALRPGHNKTSTYRRSRQSRR